MKHLNGNKNKANKSIKKTCQKSGSSNSGKNCNIIKNLRTRSIVKNDPSTFRCQRRSSEMQNKSSSSNQATVPSVVFRSTEHYTGLNTFKNKVVTFYFENGDSEIYVEDVIGNQEPGSLVVEFFSYKNSNEEKQSLVVLKPRTSDSFLQLHANEKNDLELHECKSPNSALGKKYFILHQEIAGFVSFECFCPQGLYIGVKKNRLELMKKKEDDKTGTGRG
ncbi:interleukin-33 [Dromiciops gliroides]|uniref:interleukin-33 n=1 Tax=Dromiciops gliroides TaxID=33562 RepID=UPI001CC749BF|nr:interleukin-33 [Dromiciops gliroides]